MSGSAIFIDTVNTVWRNTDSAIFWEHETMPGIDSFTKLTLHMNSDFSDSSASGHTPTINGATIDTGIKKFGAGSGEFVRPSAQYVTYPNSTDWNFGSGDFTLDFWVRFTSLDAPSIGLISAHRVGAFAWQLIYRVNSQGTNNTIEVWDDSQASELQSAVWVPSLNTQYHIALVRDGNTLRFFVEGIANGTVNVTGLTFDNNSNAIAIGSLVSDTGLFTLNGHLDELRVSKGVARWTSNFTPPIAEYTSDGAGGTVILRRRTEGE